MPQLQARALDSVLVDLVEPVQGRVSARSAVVLLSHPLFLFSRLVSCVQSAVSRRRKRLSAAYRASLRPVLPLPVMRRQNATVQRNANGRSYLPSAVLFLARLSMAHGAPDDPFSGQVAFSLHRMPPRGEDWRPAGAPGLAWTRHGLLTGFGGCGILGPFGGLALVHLQTPTRRILRPAPHLIGAAGLSWRHGAA